MGGLFSPGAYMTATRQFVAQSNSWSLEQLTLRMKIWDGEEQIGNDSFLVFEMFIEGANWPSQDKGLVLTSDLSSKLQPLVFTWVHLEENQK